MNKYLKYLKYVAIHKYYVARECFKYGLYWRGITHDLSKLFPSEFFAYAEYFYGKKKEREFFKYQPEYIDMSLVPYGLLVEDKFNIAWLHHQKRNKHHWQYWVLMEDSGQKLLLPIPDKYRKEMLADWRGAGIAITGKDNTPEWYEKNKSNMSIHSSTMQWIEEEIK